MKYFLYVGNIYPHKNLESAIKAVSILNRNSDSKVQFIIICARNKFTPRLESLVSKLHAQEFVKLMGFVPDEKLKSLYENSVGFIYPSLSEGFGLPGLEALNAGTLLLASDIPVFKEIYTSHAIYFDPKNIDSIQNSIKKALSITKEERIKIIAENKKFIKRYSWQKMAEKNLEVYNNLANL